MPPAESPTKASTSSPSQELSEWVWAGVAFYVIYLCAKAAYEIRMGAINEYGPVIHEFDPYFNFRATEYLYWNGWRRFFRWFDHMVWYPLGRPVGTTIYPGMQFTAVWINRYILPSWSLNDVCCYIPVWGGVTASFFTALITYEILLPVNTSSSLVRYMFDIYRGHPTTVAPQHQKPMVLGLHSPALESAVATLGMMAIVPAHLMRSMGGGYDNESVAMTAMVMTFYFWVRSLRVGDNHSQWFGILTGLAYFYMVAAWGGYVFVLNLIGTHAAVLVLMGRFTTKVYTAYSLFYVIGTSLAIQLPIVGWTPLKSLEQLAPFGVFMGYQLLQLTEIIRRRRQLTRWQSWMLRIQVGIAAAVLAGVLAYAVAPKGYFGPISARVRGLFVKHTKTGNPLVDSVAEHQPASSRAYFQYLHHVCSLAPVGYLMIFFQLSEASSFVAVWGAAAYFFSNKMVRLILLTSPIGSICAGMAAGQALRWCVRQWWETVNDAVADGGDKVETVVDEPTTQSNGKPTKEKKKKAGKRPAGNSQTTSASRPTGRQSSGSTTTDAANLEGLTVIQDAIDAALKTREGIFAKRAAALMMLFASYTVGVGFVNYCWRLSGDLANPTIIVKARRRGESGVIIVDDYREAYWWLRDNTPKDARVMAWWDYGYQISAIANRTTIADGNTWNHEHIALLGKALTTEFEEGWSISRHLADYMLVWAGGGGDDLAKSPHLARIANSVYRDHCPDDPTCRAFGFVDRQGTPSAMMGRSMLYRLHSNKIKPGVEVPADRFQEVFRSKYGKVRIYKVIGVSEESKAWVADPANRVCDVDGSWFCPGQYPPGLQEILAKKTDFQQLEDFNRGSRDDEYQKRYFEDLENPEVARRKAREKERQARIDRGEDVSDMDMNPNAKNQDQKRVPSEIIKKIYSTWEDTADTTQMWQLIHSNKIGELKAWLDMEPEKAFIRSKDGRGPMWWAFEHRSEDATKVLMQAGVPHTDKDAKGLTPVDLLEGGATLK